MVDLVKEIEQNLRQNFLRTAINNLRALVNAPEELVNEVTLIERNYNELQSRIGRAPEEEVVGTKIKEDITLSILEVIRKYQEYHSVKEGFIQSNKLFTAWQILLLLALGASIAIIKLLF